MTKLAHNTFKKTNRHSNLNHEKDYAKFRKIDGSHPFQEAAPDSVVKYRARKRHGGKVVFFNFDLASAMGLIPKGHPSELNPELEAEILATFSLVIINEYDQMNKVEFDPEDILPGEYMATRYLQLQHPNKQGKTSGDGRSVWNGHVTHKGVTWDISSCGTGATCLSPATHIYNKFFQTGDPTISYGCGYAETDEGFGTLFFSEVFNRNRISTERVLAIIEFEKGISITVRAHQNLIRPSHIFAHLKQGNYEALKNVVDYYVERQRLNGEWEEVPSAPKAKYLYFLDKVCEAFARQAARFEDDYIFCWFDWDGDNVLMDAGVIDYGSIRQFGLYHSEYRYDDVERYSTSIKEQKDKARYTIQTFAQAVDFLITKKRRSIKDFRNAKVLKSFERYFREQKNRNLLYKLGLNEENQNYLLENHTKTIEKFRAVFHYFEAAKSVEGLHDVEDGINWNAIFCMRDILRELPQLFLSGVERLKPEDFIEVIKSSYATAEDLELTSYRKKKIEEFQKLYLDLAGRVADYHHTAITTILLQMTMRSSVINKYDRVTGDSIGIIVEKIMAHKPRFKPNEVYELLREFIDYQDLNPDGPRRLRTSANREVKKERFVKGLVKIVRDYREGL